MSSMTKNEPLTSFTHVAFIEESSDFVPRKSLHQTKTKLNFVTVGSRQNEVYLDAFQSKFNFAWNLDSV